MESADQTVGVVELLAIENELDRAIVDADLARIGQILDEDWVIVGPDGALIDRSAFMAAIRSGSLTHASMASTELRARSYGESGLVTARVVTVGGYRGSAFRTVERSTDVFVRHGGDWRCVLTHLTTIPAASEHSE
jgi:ketosteroid isomerase-like protein